MKRCVYLFLLSILLVAGLTACGSGKAEQEVPSLTEIEGMTNDEAAEALSGFCRHQKGNRDSCYACGLPFQYEHE